MIRTERRVKKDGKERFLPQTALIWIVAQEGDHTPNWFVCGCYNADDKYIDTAVFSRSYIEKYSQ
jgi:hypothetical protein